MNSRNTPQLCCEAKRWDREFLNFSFITGQIYITHLELGLSLKQNQFYNTYKINKSIQKQINGSEEFAILCGFQGLKNFGYNISTCNFTSGDSDTLLRANKVKRLAMEYL